MRSLCVILVVFMSFNALADDVPLAERVIKSQEVPFDGLLLNDVAAVATAKRIKACEAKVPVLEEAVKSQIPLWVPIVVGVLAASAAAGVTFGVMSSTK